MSSPVFRARSRSCGLPSVASVYIYLRPHQCLHCMFRPFQFHLAHQYRVAFFHHRFIIMQLVDSKVRGCFILSLRLLTIFISNSSARSILKSPRPCALRRHIRVYRTRNTGHQPFESHHIVRHI
ncbi:hypothetical protein CY34DRAFT_691077 [Suillus luteus UH-Slu-Lm8-n1]|uniref:Uncharacterized protein n=1 Tax=Suillus luteus UH-Slu-Lm8-n1 TaxID=930992 RepID=A0A0D0AHB5_9AGAM|nr:hypothetical protein CY34DRAFT_691077 [Suillus luteus UH-Slu-Lm8-n1]